MPRYTGSGVVTDQVCGVVGVGEVVWACSFVGASCWGRFGEVFCTVFTSFLMDFDFSWLKEYNY